jgi:hypothetical protein
MDERHTSFPSSFAILFQLDQRLVVFLFTHYYTAAASTLLLLHGTTYTVSTEVRVFHKIMYTQQERIETMQLVLTPVLNKTTLAHHCF